MPAFLESMPLLAALAAGFGFFFSGCNLPLYPAYLSYITGLSVAKLREQGKTRNVAWYVLAHAACFVAGASVVFYAIGLTTGMLGAWLGGFLKEYADLFRITSGLILIGMGAMMLGWFHLRWFVGKQWQPSTHRRMGYAGSFLIGLGFGASGSTCNVALLGSVVVGIAQEPDAAFTHMSAFVIGYALPFLICAFFLSKIRGWARYTGTVMRISGALMIFFGLLLCTGQLNNLLGYFPFLNRT